MDRVSRVEFQILDTDFHISTGLFLLDYQRKRLAEDKWLKCLKEQYSRRNNCYFQYCLTTSGQPPRAFFFAFVHVTKMTEMLLSRTEVFGLTTDSTDPSGHFPKLEWVGLGAHFQPSTVRSSLSLPCLSAPKGKS